MKMLSLVGKHLAQPGLEFVYLGLPKECEGCRLRSSCDNLEPGIRYRVISIKTESIQECSLHQSGVILVELEIPDIMVAVPPGLARGSILKYKPQECAEIECEYHQYCVPPGVKPGKDYQLVKIGKTIPCPRSRELRLVELRYLWE